MQVHVQHLGGVTFSIEAREHSLICDQPVPNGGSDQGMTPPELLLASLGSCAAYYTREYLHARSLPETGIEVTVTAEKLSSPARLGGFRIQVHCSAALTDQQQHGVVRSVHACLIHNTLMSVPEIEIELKTPVLSC